jgi:hypothetical protein
MAVETDEDVAQLRGWSKHAAATNSTLAQRLCSPGHQTGAHFCVLEAYCLRAFRHRCLHSSVEPPPFECICGLLLSTAV